MTVAAVALALLGVSPPPAQDPPAPTSSAATTVCGLEIPEPARTPPPGSGPVMLSLVLCFERQGGTSSVEPATYLYYIRTRPSEPSQDRWLPFDESIEQSLLGDFKRLWATGFLDDLAIEILDRPLGSGAIGKIAVFHMEERRRVRLIDYEGATRISRSDIADRLRERGIDLRLESFVDEGVVRRVAGVVREMYAENGYRHAAVTPTISAMAGGPKLAHVRFAIDEGPRVAIRDVDFIGNTVLPDEALAGAFKTNRPQSLLSLVTGRGMFDEEAFEEDAQRVIDLYRDRGYITARVGQPVLRELDDSADGATRWVQLRVEVSEGRQFRIGNFTVEGASVVPAEVLESLFDVKQGDRYSQKRLTKGLERARELYGAAGYFEFTAYPDVAPRDGDPPTADVTIRVAEGPQYFVRRIEFLGNTLTRDTVIRRELALVEGGVFNTDALKHGVRRLNQLGYFKPLDEEAVSVERAPGTTDRVDVKVKVEEQNRNQLTFGAGTSQYEGLFVSFSYTTSNFMGRGESVTAVAQRGTRANTYQLSFSQPFVLGRAVTAGGSLFSRKIDYSLTSGATDYSEVRSGFDLTSGVPLWRYSRLFLTYGYEVIDAAMAASLQSSLGAASALVLGADGRHTESSVTPTFVYNTTDHPLVPRRGSRVTVSYRYAGGPLGGSRQFAKPEAEAVLYLPLSRRTAVGLRANAGRIWNYGSRDLPYYQRYFLGGEQQIRGVDVRSVGPRNQDGVVVGGTSFVLFNAEYYVDLLPQVRALAFHDAGQAYGETQRIDLRQLRTSTGVELRITMPVLNVPFRLIYAWNLYRDVSQPARGFRFAIGTTF